MKYLTIAIVLVILFLEILQILNVVTFLSSWQSESKSKQPEKLPKAAIILCLRGADPFLADCIEALLKQNYDEYTLKIVVDSKEDPAWSIVQQVIEKCQPSYVQVSPLRKKYETCSLKCSSLIQAISELDQSYEVVAFIDSDVVADPNWLRQLIAPLADEQVGATTGFRWYSLRTKQWGSLLRTICNKSSTIYMYRNKIPWGGSMALKRSLLDEAEVLATWKKSLSVDTPLTKIINQAGLSVKFVPSLIMLNQEECDIGGCLRFLVRQLLVARLYRCSRTEWASGLGISLVYFLSIILAIVAILFDFLWGNFLLSFELLTILAGYIFSTVWLMVLLENWLSRDIAGQDAPMTYLSAFTNLKMFIVVPLVELVMGWAMLAATFKGSVTWRGISYKFSDPWNVQLVEYSPYLVSPQSSEAKSSVI